MFDTEFPDKVYEGQAYEVTYTMHFDSTLDDHVIVSDAAIPHSNIHSCFHEVGFCTPFVSNDGETSTHTPAQVGDWLIGDTVSTDFHASFSHMVELQEGMYTVIAHGRFYTEGDNQWCEASTGINCTKWDVSNAILGHVVLGKENEIKLSSYVKIVSYVMIGAAELFLDACLLIMGLFYKTRIMRFSQRQVLIAMVVLGKLSVFGLLILPEVTEFSCNFRPWLIGVPLFTMFNLLLGKTWRIWKVVVSASFKKVKVRQIQVVLYALGLDMIFILPQLIHTIAFGAPSPNRVGSDVNDTDFSIECTTDSQTLSTLLAIFSTLVSLGVGVKFVRATSGTVTLFNESKYIGFAIYNIGLLVVVCLPLLLVIEQQPNVTFLIQVVMVVLIACTCCGSLIIPKLALLQADGVDLKNRSWATKGEGGGALSMDSKTSRSPGTGDSTSPSTTGTRGSTRNLLVGRDTRMPGAAQSAVVDSSDSSSRYVTSMKSGLLSRKLVVGLQKAERSLKSITDAGGAGFKVKVEQIDQCKAELVEAQMFLDHLWVKH